MEPELLAPETLGPPPEIRPVSPWTVVPASPRRFAPPEPAAPLATTRWACAPIALLAATAGLVR